MFKSDDSDNIIKEKFTNILEFFNNNNQRFEFPDLTKHQRKLINQLAESNKLFHWTKRSSGVIYLSNMSEDKKYYEKATNNRNVNDLINDKVNELEDQINNMTISSTKLKALQIEKLSFTTSTPSKNAIEAVDKVLNEPNIEIKNNGFVTPGLDVTKI